MVKPDHACHLLCISFQLSFQLVPILLTMQYGHNKHTLHYIVIAPDLENVEVVCTFNLQLSASYLDPSFC